MSDEAAGVTPPSVAFGAVFRAAREQAGVAMEEVAASLHLDTDVIAAVEEGRFTALPLRTYSRGYVRRYARLVGLDADDMVARFDGIYADEPEPSAMVPRHRIPRRTEFALRPLALRYVSIVVLLLLALAVVLWTVWRGSDWPFPLFGDDDVDSAEVSGAATGDAPTPAEPVVVSPWPEADGAVASGEDEVPDAVTPAAEEAAETDPFDEEPGAATRTALPATDGERAASERVVSNVVFGQLVVTFDEESWVSVHDAFGEQIYGDLGRPGMEVPVEGAVPLSVLVGFATGVRVEFDGEPVDLAPYINRNAVARFEVGG